MTTKAATAKTTADAITSGETTFTDAALNILDGKPATAPRRTKATATSAPAAPAAAKPAAAKATSAPKAKAEPKATDRTICAGGVYLADPEKRVECKDPVASASNRLCKKHSGEYKAGAFRMSGKGLVQIRALLDAGVDVRYGHRPAPVGADGKPAAKAPKAASAGSTPKAAGVKAGTKRTPRNSGGTVRTSKPPVPEMHSGPIASTAAGKRVLASA